MTVKTTVAPGSSFTVPAGITKVRARAKGAAGPRAGSSGRGAIVESVLSVSPSDVLAVAAILGGLGGTTSSPGTSQSAGSAGGSGVSIGGLVIAGGGGGPGAALSTNGTSFIVSGPGGDGGMPGADGGDGQITGTSGTGGKGGKGAVGASGGVGGSGGGDAGAAGQDYSAGGAGGAGGNGSSGTSGSSSYPGAAGGGGGGGGYAGGGGGSGGSGKGAMAGAGGGGSSLGDTFVGYNETTTANADFEMAGAPKVPTAISPTGNIYQDRTSPIVLSFQHNPDTPGDALDAQTDGEVRYRKVESPAGSWTTVSSLGTATATSIAANTLDVAQYEWQARTKADGAAGDANGVWGAWTDSRYFRAATPPATPTITSPAALDTIAVATLTATWTAPGEVEYQARLTGDNAGAADESVIYSTASGTTALTATLAAGTNNVTAHVQVRVRTTAGGLWSQWADVRVSISWAGPPKPVVILATGISGIYVTVTSPAATGIEPTADRIEVYVHEGDVTERRAVLDPGDPWIYETPPSGVDIGIEAVAIYTPTNVQTSSGVTW